MRGNRAKIKFTCFSFPSVPNSMCEGFLLLLPPGDFSRWSGAKIASSNADLKTCRHRAPSRVWNGAWLDAKAGGVRRHTCVGRDLFQREKPTRPDQGPVRRTKGYSMGNSSFPNRIIARFDPEDYATLREQADAHGYQMALVIRWMLLPQSYKDLQPGKLADLEARMSLPFPSGRTPRSKDTHVKRNIYLTDAEYEVVTRIAARYGLLRGSYVTLVLADQIGIGKKRGWPLPEDMTNASVEMDARRALREMREAANR